MGLLCWINLFCRHLCDVFRSISTSPSCSSLGKQLLLLKSIKKPTIKSRNHRRLHWLAPVSRLDHRFWRLARFALVMLPVLQGVSWGFLYTNKQHLGDKVSNELVTRIKRHGQVSKISVMQIHTKNDPSVYEKRFDSPNNFCTKRACLSVKWLVHAWKSVAKFNAFPAKSSKFSNWELVQHSTPTILTDKKTLG